MLCFQFLCALLCDISGIIPEIHFKASPASRMKLQQKSWVTRGTSTSPDAAVQEECGLTPHLCLMFTPLLKLCKAMPECHCLTSAPRGGVSQAQVTPSYWGVDTS